MKRMIYVVAIAVVVAVGLLGWGLISRSAYESAEYAVLESDGVFEIREYPTLMMATTGMEFAEQGRDGSFMRLFRYISGRNDRERKVSMTTPVFMEPGTTKSEGQMGFVIPKDVSDSDIPEPTDGAVDIQERRGGKFAVVRFTGRMDAETAADAEVTLRDWISERGLVGEKSSEFAGYDAPYVPGPLRRNEVLIRLRPAAEG